MRLTLARCMPGITANKKRRPKNFNLKFSNKWHDTNEILIKDQRYREACEARGIRVYDSQVTALETF